MGRWGATPTPSRSLTKHKAHALQIYVLDTCGSTAQKCFRLTLGWVGEREGVGVAPHLPTPLHSCDVKADGAQV